MRQFTAIFSNGASDRFVSIEANTLDDAMDMAEAIYIVLNNGFELMVVDTQEVVDTLR